MPPLAIYNLLKKAVHVILGLHWDSWLSWQSLVIYSAFWCALEFLTRASTNSQVFKWLVRKIFSKLHNLWGLVMIFSTSEIEALSGWFREQMHQINPWLWAVTLNVSIPCSETSAHVICLSPVIEDEKLLHMYLANWCFSPPNNIDLFMIIWFTCTTWCPFTPLQHWGVIWQSLISLH